MGWNRDFSRSAEEAKLFAGARSRALPLNLSLFICRNAKDKQNRGSRGNAAKIGLIKDELESPELGESVYKDA